MYTVLEVNIQLYNHDNIVLGRLESARHNPGGTSRRIVGSKSCGGLRGGSA